MNILHDSYDNDSLDCLITTAYSIYEAVGRTDRTPEKMAARKKEITMHANGHTTVWGTHIGVSRSTDTKSWYQQIQDRWTAYKATRHDAQLATLRARWDARREAVRPFRAEAAPEMAAAQHTLSVATMLYGLAL
jgi:hypothetical protein